MAISVGRMPTRKPGFDLPNNWIVPAICVRMRHMRIRRKGLRRFAETGDARGIPGHLKRRLHLRLKVLDNARMPADMDLPGYRLHPLRANRSGYWSVRVSGNWRLIFRFERGEAVDVDLIDYH